MISRKWVFKDFGARRRGQRPATLRERGITLVVATVAFLSFLAAAGLAIDISHFYLAGTELQNAADAAALAAASALNSTSSGIKQATDNAVASMNKFEFDQVSVSIGRSNVVFANNLADLNGSGGMSEATAIVSPQKVRFVKVTVPPKNVGIFFANFVLNTNTKSLTREAVAGQSEAGASGDFTPNEICNTYRITLIEGSSPADGSLDRVDPLCGSSFQYTPGCTYNVHLTPPCDSQLSYYELTDVDNGKTYTDWDDRIADRMIDCFYKGNVRPILTHPQAANIKNGLNVAFGVYGGGLTSTQYPPDQNVKQNITFAQYQTAGIGSLFHSPPATGTGIVGRRVMVLPIMQKDSFVALDPNGDSANITIDRFGAFFLTKKPSVNTRNNTADIQLEYIGDRVSVGGQAKINPARPMDSTTAKGLATPVLYR